MTFPWQLEIGDYKLPPHVIFETAGLFAGFRFFLHLRKHSTDEISTANRVRILIGAIFGSVLGSRLIGGLEDPYVMMSSTNIFFHFYSNKTIVGGLLGGLAGVELVKKIIGEKRSSGDLFTYPIIFAMIIGRIGCFSMGVFEETYGVVTHLPWGMDLGDGKLRHPVCLYEIVFLAALWVLLKRLDRKFSFANGGLFKAFMIAYLLFRFFLDFIKPHYSFPFGLSTIQLACVAGLTYYSIFIIKPRKLLTAYA